MTKPMILNGDLFALAVPGSVLLHACNAHGVWGAGVAAAFRVRFPKSYAEYRAYCLNTPHTVGTAFVCSEENGFRVACLITSQGFGGSVDSPDIITANTRSSLVALKAFIGPAEQIFSPKINAGIFRTPWETTEKVIEESGFERWTVCALDGSGATNLHK